MRAPQLWQLALSRDPSESNAATGVLGGTMVIAVPWQAEPAQMATAHLLEEERRAGAFKDFESERRDVVELLRAHARLYATERAYEAACAIDAAALRAVIEGPQFEQLPYVDIKSKLLASQLSHPTRRFKDSDTADVAFVSKALPVCHAMIVDADMRERIRQLKLDVRYGTHVFKAAEFEPMARWLDDRRCVAR